MSDGSVWVLIPLAAIIGSTIVGLKHGRRPRGGAAALDDRTEHLAHLTAQNTMLQNRIVDLEARVRTLERIATDPAQRLAQEIERLA